MLGCCCTLRQFGLNFQLFGSSSNPKYDDASLEKEAAEIFGAADKDNNQVLSHTELKKYIQEHSEVRKRLLIIGSGEDCGWHGLFKDADDDGDGEISLAVGSCWGWAAAAGAAADAGGLSALLLGPGGG